MSEQTFDLAFTEIKTLAENFQANEQEYLKSSYSEADVRRHFIDKFWKALGWDVYHERERNPYEQEVKVERGVNVSNRLKKADYAFFAAPNFRDVKFYVEAKKPARNLDNADDYFQTIRYGWSSNTPVAVLTDFEPFRVLDYCYKPNFKMVGK
jgi:adenine-specific DNA-methyltransferase